jgi:N6-adenosine-specific RNA methylase IME4
MTSLPAIIPTSVPQAKRALALMERDLGSKKTYEAIRETLRAAEAMKALYREVDEVREKAETVIVLAKHRIGEEIRALPDARGGDRKSDQKVSRGPFDRPTLKQQVGSKKRGTNLKKLAAVPKLQVKQTIRELHAAGKEATATAVLKAVNGEDKVERRAERERERELARKQAPLKDKYGVIYADPPWRLEPYSRKTGLNRAADNHYPTMTLDRIKALDVPAAKDAVLFLWATVPMLLEALEVMTAWGFGYRSHCIWHKNKVGTGYWFRNQHELLLVGVRGSIPAPAPGTQYSSAISAPVSAHSAKPLCFRQMIEDMFPKLRRIELFARERFSGWDCWGNEVLEAAE